ncbi:MAG TPA: hypothetical protein DF480_05155 [Clostridiales bacterium]|nr:hypothetical protein [Clostridiales bacterium]
MSKPDYRKKEPPDSQGQLTINIFAMFMSVVVFLFIQQAGILLLNVMFSLSYPSNLDNVTNMMGTIILIIFLTFLFGLASQMGYGIIRRTKAENKIFVVYNVVILLILFIQGITVAFMTVPMYIVPNLLIGIATMYSLYTIIKGVPDRFVHRIKKLKK